MIRKAIIIVLTLAAVGMAVIDVESFRPRTSQTDSYWSYQSDLFFCTCSAGVVYFVFYRCPQCGSYCKHVATCKWSNRPLRGGRPAVFNRLRFGQFEWTLIKNRHSYAHHLSLPALAPLGLFAAYPTIAFIRGPLRRYRRRRRGLCIRCGYNLEGNESGVCPECGRPCAMHLR